MKKIRKIHLFIIFLMPSCQCILSQGLLDELEQLHRFDRLPRYLENGLVEQFSSYDRAGNNNDGFSGTYSFIRMEGEDQVIAEMEGPGVINRIWTPTPSADTIQFFFDGEDQPGISLPFEDLFISNRFPFLNPICGHEVGGYYCYLPIPYSKSCKVVFKGKMLFYQLQYRTYPGKTRIRSFSYDWKPKEKEALERAVDVWNNFGMNFIYEIYPVIMEKTTEVRLIPGHSISFFEMNTGGRILGIEIEGMNNIDRNDNNLVLKAKWNGEDNWAIYAPLKDLLGYYFGEISMQSLLAGTNKNISYIYYPMPFSNSARLELEYLDPDKNPADLNLRVRIFYSHRAQQKNEGKFYVHWRREIYPPDGQPYTIMPTYYGRGHYVGTILICQGLIPGYTNYFEGDDQAIIDGKLRLHGTGSEDYFNGGWYLIPDRWDMAHSLPSHGCLGYSIALSRTGGYRHYFADKLSFTNDFSLTIEHGPEENKYPVDYRSVAFYYANEGLQQVAPTVEMAGYPKPETIKWQACLLKIEAFRNGSITNGQWFGNKQVLILEPSGHHEPMLVKFDMDIPVNGYYRLFCSYFRTPTSGEVKFMQRQISLTDWKDNHSLNEEYVEKEYIGMVNVINGKCTVTIFVSKKEERHFILHELILEKE